MQSPIRKKLLEAFTNANGEFISGQKLADILNCSRTAVWKHIEELRNSGFEIEAVRRKGYRVVNKSEKVSENEIQLGLQTKKFGQVIRYLETVDSTQRAAVEFGQQGLPEGTLVIADEQTSGRGRLARSWHSPKHAGIWMSLILRPNVPPQQAPQFTLITAVAVVQAIEEVCGIQADIKWPNDILIAGKKITGILTEMQAEADKINFIVIGIGMNVNQKEEDFPPELQEIATSLAIQTGKRHSRAALVQTILLKLEKYYELYLEKGFTPIKLLWESYSNSIGKEITARTITGSITGKALGISETGVLKLRDNQGNIHDIYSADIDIPE